MLKGVVWLGVLLASSNAFAAGQTLDKWVVDLAAKPAEAEKRLAACDVIVLPNGEARRPCKLTVTDLAGTDKDVVLKATKVQKKKWPKSVLEWTEANVEVRVGKKLVNTFHVFELTSDEPGGGVLIQHWSKLVQDKDAIAAANGNKLGTPKLTPGRAPERAGLETQDQGDRRQGLDQLESTLSSTDDIKQMLAEDAKSGFMVVGSAPGQRYTGKAGSKTLAGWKMDVKWSGKPMTGGSPLVQWGYMPAVATTKDKTPVTLTYGALMVQVSRMSGGGSPSYWPALVIFSVPQ